MTTEKTKTKAEKTKTPPITKIKEKIPKRSASTKAAKAQNLAPHKLMLLITVIPRNKAEFYLDLLQQFEVNLQIDVSAFGTASKAYGFFESAAEKQALFSVIREDNVPKALEALEEKFQTIRGGKGVACTIPFTSMVGVLSYQFLSNKQ